MDYKELIKGARQAAVVSTPWGLLFIQLADALESSMKENKEARGFVEPFVELDDGDLHDKAAAWLKRNEGNDGGGENE